MRVLADPICKAMNESPNLTVLELCGNTVGIAAGAQIAKCLETKHKLKVSHTNRLTIVNR